MSKSVDWFDERSARFFWRKVKKTDSCWLWTGSTHEGYGTLRRTRGGRQKKFQAHRFAYELLVGPIPEGMTLDHLCHNNDKECQAGNDCIHRRCVNPAHLEPTPNIKNILRGKGWTAKNARKTHCPHGHEYNAKNTFININGSRVCIICRRNNDRVRRAKKRQEKEKM